MSLIEAIVLGIVQGLTEFLPISSTAHLKIVPALFGWQDPGAAFSAVIQIGTLAAVIAYFRTDLARIASQMLQGLLRGSPLGTSEARLGWMIVAGTVPIVVCGIAFKQHIETTLRSVYVICAALIVVALAMELAEQLMLRRIRAAVPQKGLNEIGWTDTLVIGMAQALALIPGTSRSGVTIAAGLFRDLDRPTAARFSFLLSLPAVFAAGAFQLAKQWDALTGQSQDAINLVAATLMAALSGYAAIAFLLNYLRTRTTRVFVVYRIVLAAVLLGLLWGGYIVDA